MDNDALEIKIEKFKNGLFYFLDFFISPYFRRIIRFLALPYCYFFMINWKQCRIGRLRVLYDILYIFFVFKYFPDNYSRCRLYEKDKKMWKYYYGSNYDPYQRAKLRKFVQQKKYEIAYEDKQLCYQICFAAGLPLPRQYAIINLDDNYQSIIESAIIKNNLEKVIIKPIGGRAGINIFLAYKHDGAIHIRDKNNSYPLRDLKIYYPSVVQEYIDQHHTLKNISSSVNTIRLVTMLTKKKDVLIIGAYMRFGVGNSFTDNVSGGGISAAIDIENGRLKSEAFDKNGKKYLKHMTSGILFKDFQIPFWNEVIDIGKKIQQALPYYRLLGHDIAITKNGPIIVEINAIYDNVGLEQKCGPILANNEVLRWYGYYNLLINKSQLNLFRKIVK